MGRVIRRETVLREEVFAVYRALEAAARSRRPISVEEVRRAREVAQLARQIDNDGRLQEVIRRCGVGSEREAEVRTQILAEEAWYGSGDAA